jgi:hypothetical protein
MAAAALRNSRCWANIWRGMPGCRRRVASATPCRQGRSSR